MKKITLSLVMITIALTVLAQPPQAFKYQAVVRNAVGEIMSNQAVDIRVNVHNETPAGTIIYQEIFSETTNQFGLINLNIGLGTPVGSYNFESIDWSVDSKFLEIEMDDSSGYISLGTSELLAVPYSLYSDRSKDAPWEISGNDVYYDNGNVGIGTATPAFKLDVTNLTPGGSVETSVRTDGAGGAIAAYSSTFPSPFAHFADRVSLWSHYLTASGLDLRADGTASDIRFYTGGWATSNERIRITSDGNVGIGTTNLATGHILSVDGKIACEEVLVEYSGSWPDYVFKEEYKLPEIGELEAYIQSTGHLPDLPSAREVEENGFYLADMQKHLLQKIEELTLYTIEQDKLIREMRQEIDQLNKEVIKFNSNDIH